jgi:hypothetical protein
VKFLPRHPKIFFDHAAETGFKRSFRVVSRIDPKSDAHNALSVGALPDRIDGLYDEARTGRPRTISEDAVAALIERTL